jgi:hypothetical protein
MSEKFNELIELIISEENDQAKELFHEIIVDKSRSIYESLIDEDEVVDEDEEVDESDEDLEESDFDEELGGDAAEDMIDDISADEEGLALEDEHEDEEMEDRVVDLEDALDELKAEFEQLMGGDDEGEEEMDMDMEPEMDDMEMDMEPEEEEEGEEDETEESFVREYTEKVAAPSNSEEGEKASGPVGNAKSKPHNGEAKPASSPGTAETGMTPPKAAKQTKVAGNVDAKQSAV